jgi:hypothetical protein
MVLLSQFEHYLIHIAPTPRLSGLDAAHDRVARLMKCLVACLPIDESQQPTCPHSRQSLRCTHSCPIFRHSSQPLVCGFTART